MLKSIRCTGLAVIATAMLFLSSATHADQRAPAQGTPKTSTRQVTKWETDAVVQHGMDAIRQAITARQADIRDDRLSARDYQQLAAVVDKNLADIAKNSKLNKESNAAFHKIVLPDLTQTTELMRASPKPEIQRVGALGVLQSLRTYGEFFIHPGWKMDATLESPVK